MSRTYAVAIVCVLLGAGAFVVPTVVCQPAAGQETLSREPGQGAASPEQRAEDIVAKMKNTPEWMVGQVCMVSIWGYDFGPEYLRPAQVQERWEKTVRLIRDYHVGSVLLLESNFSNVDKAWTPPTTEQVASISYELQRVAKDVPEGMHPLPLFIAIDQEGDGYPWTRIRNGVVPIPSNMAIGATWNLAFAEKVGEIVGRQLSLLGINMLLGPVLDVNTDPVRDAMGERCFGGNPYFVGRMGRAYIRGVHKGAGDRPLAVVAKHWPGHGDCDALSDYQIAPVTRTLQELAENELVPFLMVINADDKEAKPDAMMPAHAVYTELQTHRDYPITLDTSHDVVWSFVLAAEERPLPAEAKRHMAELGRWRDHGLIVSDALGVEGLIDNYGMGYEGFPYADAAERCLRAGHDIVMLTGYGRWFERKQEEVIEHLAAVYRRGIEPAPSRSDAEFAARVQEAARRVVAAKLRLIGQEPLNTPGPEAAAQLAEVLKEDMDSLWATSNGAWARAVQWAKRPDLPPPSPDARVVTVEPRELDRRSVKKVSAGIVADLLADKRSPASSPVARLDEYDISAWLSGDDTEIAVRAGELIDAAQWVIVVLGHRPRTAEEKQSGEDSEEVDSVECSLKLIRKLDRSYKGASTKRVAVIACQPPYYLQPSDLGAVNAYLITHTKLPDYLELAVDALLTNREAADLFSPVSIPAIPYHLSDQKHALLVPWLVPDEGAERPSEVGPTNPAKAAWAAFWGQSAQLKAGEIALGSLALVLVLPHAWIMRILPVGWPWFNKAVALAYRLPCVGRLKLFSAYRRRLRRERALRTAAHEYVDLPFRFTQEDANARLQESDAGLQEIIASQLPSAHYVAVVGGPGWGTSTVVWRLCYEALEGRRALRRYVPIVLHGIEYTDSVKDLMLRSLGQYGCPCTEAILDAQLEAGGLLILIDGVSEVRDESADHFEDDLCGLIKRRGRNCYLMTSSSPPRLGALGGCLIDLSPLSKEHVIDLLAKHLPPKRQDKAGPLGEEIAEKLGGIPLTPLMLRMVAGVYIGTGSLAPSRAALLRSYCNELLRQEVTGIDPDASDYALRHLAFTLFVERGGKRGCTVDEANNALEAIGDKLKTDKGVTMQAPWVRRRLQQARLLTRSGRHVGFCHDVFEDYFAARFVKEGLDRGDREPYGRVQSDPAFAGVRAILEELQSMPPRR